MACWLLVIGDKEIMSEYVYSFNEKDVCALASTCKEVCALFMDRGMTIRWRRPRRSCILNGSTSHEPYTYIPSSPSYDPFDLS
jgi:hypothetical protein